MSVLVLLRFKGDPTQIEKTSRDNPQMMTTIIEQAKANGLLRHRFFGTGDEIIVVDEWPDEGSFQKFFSGAPEIQQLMGQAGVTSEPEITFARQLDVNDAVG